MGSGLFDELAPDVAAKVAAAGVRERHPPGTFLFHAGDRPEAAYLVETGLVRVDRTTPSGKRVLVTLARPGDLVGELALIDKTRRSASCSVVTSARFLIIPAEAWTDLMRSEAALAYAVTRRVVRRHRVLTDQLVAASALDARARVAARLRDLLDLDRRDHPSPRELRLPISQEDLAHWAGLSREGAVRAIKELREAGVLTTGRKRVTVLDEPALRDLAAEAEL